MIKWSVNWLRLLSLLQQTQNNPGKKSVDFQDSQTAKYPDEKIQNLQKILC